MEHLEKAKHYEELQEPIFSWQIFQTIIHHYFLVIVNAIRLRLPFCKKRNCFAKILKKETREMGMTVPFGEDLVGGVTIQIFLFHLKVNGKPTFIEVDQSIYEKFDEGRELSVEYIEGTDRIHAKLILGGT